MSGRLSSLRRWGLVLAAAAALSGCGGASRGPAGPGSAYSFWPPLPDEPRVQFLRSFRYSSDVEPPRSGFDRIVFGADARVLPIAKPYGVDTWQGRIYVCDITNPAVVILDLAERETRLMVTRGVDQMAQPTDIAIAPDGMKYVVDRKLGRIFVFDAQDRHVSSFGERGLIPAGVAVYGNELFVPDFGSESILVLDRFRGTTLRSIAPGGDDGRFVRPVGVHAGQEGELYVTDAIRGRLQKFDAGGELVMSLGQIADAPGNFVRPKHVTVDDDGIIYVVDAAFQNVQMFNPEGEVLMFFGGPGRHPGSMSLPAGIAVTADGLDLFEPYVHPAFQARRLILVTNQFGLHKVSVYALGRLKEGRTIDDIAPYAADVRSGVQPAESGEEGALRGAVTPAPETAPGEDGG